MNVLLIANDYPPVPNSAARLFSELAEGLSAKGHEVTVVTQARGGPARASVNSNVRVRRLPSPPLPRAMLLARAVQQSWQALTSWWTGRGMPKQDAIIVYSPPQPLAMVGIRLKERWHCPLIVNIQDVYPQTAIDLGLLRGGPMLKASTWMERRTYADADALTVYAPGTRDYVVSRGASVERVHVIANWIDLDEVTPGPSDNAWRHDHGLDGRFVVSFVGTMGFAQGLETVVAAAEQLVDRPDVRIVLAGGGVMRAALERQVHEKGLQNVSVLPFQEGEAYMGLLHASDACLVTLDHALTVPVVPGKLQSLMAAARPVICVANPATGLGDLIEEAQCGIFVQAGDASGLADAVRRLHHDPELAERYGLGGRAYAETHYRRADAIDAYDALLETLTGSGTS
jgi:colanic acid biosynthesis glycosyl transferase WcaI